MVCKIASIKYSARRVLCLGILLYKNSVAGRARDIEHRKGLREMIFYDAMAIRPNLGGKQNCS